MSFTCHQLFINSPPRFTLYITTSLPKTPALLSLPITSRPHFPISNHSLPNPHNSTSLSSHHSRLRVYESDGTLQSNDVVNGAFNLDYFLTVAEFLCLASSAIVSVGFALNCAVLSLKKTALVAMGNSVLASGAVALVMAVGIGAWIRMRQWRRICRESVKGGLEVNLFERIEKLEEDLRSSATIIRVLSRQLEKLGIRFRVTRKALKEPIAETAALAQKNSEATRALAVQEDNLEKELGEIQKVLLAMQNMLHLLSCAGAAAKTT
ncbi:hypothetical protein PRUPE_6G191100 [Prunus persica]|uniref:Transmembrane protein n=1 Tax=Prunus persica TaxID=3760 RepID=A0A251NSN9_PRUPE|nr:hypothetical protein PRUPE_6G191100 [Prunus persica]